MTFKKSGVSFGSAQENSLPLLLNSPTPPNIKYSHYFVYCNILRVFNIRGSGGVGG